MSEPIRRRRVVLVLTDDARRERIKEALRKRHEVVGAVALAFEGIELARFHRPDIVLFDPNLRDARAQDFLRALSEASPLTRPVAYHDFDEDDPDARPRILGVVDWIPRSAKLDSIAKRLGNVE